MIVNFLIMFLDHVYFLGEGELNRAKKLNKNAQKFIFFHFILILNFGLMINLNMEKIFCLLGTMVTGYQKNLFH